MMVAKKKASEKTEKSYNWTTVFLSPILRRSWDWYKGYVENFYYQDAKRPDLKEHLFLLLNSEDSDEYRALEAELEFHTYFCTKYDPTSTQVMFVFSIPDNFKKDYALFKLGKYSQFSDDLKDMILNLEQSGKNYDILYRTESRRKKWERRCSNPGSVISISPEAELLDPPYPDREIYRY